MVSSQPVAVHFDISGALNISRLTTCWVIWRHPPLNELRQD